MGESAPQKRFDYELLDEATRELVQQKAMETHGLLKRTAEHILLIGQNLTTVKEKLPHGQFLLWIETEFGMSRRTARHFIRVAEKLEDTWRNFHHLPVSVLYELAEPSTTEEILKEVQEGTIPPTLEAVKAAKEAERQACTEAEQAHEAIQAQQRTIEQLTEEITSLQEQLAALSAQTKVIKEVEKVVVPPEVKAHIETLHQQVQMVQEQRDALARRVTQLGEEARATTQRRGEGEQERRIRLNWYRVASEFHTVMTRLLAQWPSPLDTLAFEAEDWTRLSQTKDLAQRFLAECLSLTQTRIIDSTPPQERGR
jgi:FtsZ-binding cell division protein ZapB